MRVLIADDSRTMRLLLRGTLEPLGYEVLEADNGRGAYERLTGSDAPQLAILDWVMPQLAGPEVCQLVRQSRLIVQPHILLLTTKNSKEDVIHGLGMGANDFISKPFHEGELLARLKVGERVIQLEMALTERVHALEEAMAHVKTLQGLLPICMYCHKIRDDQDSWQRLEQYLTEHLDAKLTHGLCPDCRDRFFSDFPKTTGTPEE